MTTPTVAILLLAYCNTPERTAYALETVRSLCDDLRYDGKTVWYVAEGYGNEVDKGEILNYLVGSGQEIVDWHCERLTPGASWNRGLLACYEYTDYILVMEDDWTLTRPFDITPYVHLLQHEDEIGAVRFGTLTVGMKLDVVGYYGRHYLRMSKQTQYAFSGNPHLRHKRLNYAVGLYNEKIHPSPGDVEIDFDYRFRQQERVHIVRPADLPGWGIFQHIGSVQSYEVDD